MLEKYMLEIGYKKEEIDIIINTYPICNLKEVTLLENIKNVYPFLLKLSYTKEEIIKMTKILPSIYGLSIENINQKIEYYDSIGLHEMPVIIPNFLMQSVNLSYARYEFYKSKGIIIDKDNFKKLFIGQKQFEKQYGISKQELLEKYNYEEYLRENKICKYQYQY